MRMKRERRMMMKRRREDHERWGRIDKERKERSTYEILACPCFPGLLVAFAIILHGCPVIRIKSPFANWDACVGVVREAFAEVVEKSSLWVWEDIFCVCLCLW